MMKQFCKTIRKQITSTQHGLSPTKISTAPQSHEWGGGNAQTSLKADSISLSNLLDLGHTSPAGLGTCLNYKQMMHGSGFRHAVYQWFEELQYKDPGYVNQSIQHCHYWVSATDSS